MSRVEMRDETGVSNTAPTLFCRITMTQLILSSTNTQIGKANGFHENVADSMQKMMEEFQRVVRAGEPLTGNIREDAVQ